MIFYKSETNLILVKQRKLLKLVDVQLVYILENTFILKITAHLRLNEYTLKF